MAVGLGRLQRGAQGVAPGDDRDLPDRVGAGGEHAEQGVAGLVVGGALLLLGGEEQPAGRAQDDALDGVAEVVDAHAGVVAAGGEQGGFVHEVLQVGADHAGRAGGEGLERDRGVERHAPGVHGEDLATAGLVGGVDHDVAVEAPGAQQGRVEDLGPVGGGQHHHPLVPREPVHLGEDLVEGLLALVVAAEGGGAAPGAADGIELVDEHDGGGGLLGLVEEVAHPAGPQAHDHLDELGGRDGEEGHLGLAGDGLGQQGLAGARGAGEQHAAGDLGAEAPVALGVPEEVHDLGHLVADLVDAGHVGERGARPRGGAVAAGPGLAEPREHPAPAGGSGAAPEEPDQQTDEQQRGPEAHQELDPPGRVLGLLRPHLGLAGHELLDDLVGGEVGTLGGELLHVGHRLVVIALGVVDRLLEGAFDRGLRRGDGGDVVGVELGPEEAVGDLGAVHGRHQPRRHHPVHGEQQQDHPPHATHDGEPVGRLGLVVGLGQALDLPRPMGGWRWRRWRRGAARRPVAGRGRGRCRGALGARVVGGGCGGWPVGRRHRGAPGCRLTWDLPLHRG